MSTNNIYILSLPVRCGKTTMLQNWIKGKENIAGILTPDVAGKRKLLDIVTNSYYNLETEDGTDTITVGHFHFDKAVFNLGQQLLKEAVVKKPEWLVVDEVGKLEIERATGFEPAISWLTEQYIASAGNEKLLLVIRDTLLAVAINKYRLEDAHIIDANFFL